MSAPLVSVCITNYNYGALLGEAIESVLTQDFRDREIIVYDDASSDNSVDIIRREFGSQVTLIEADENRGQGFARNRLIDLAKGKYILFLDSDDLMAEGALRALVERIPGYDAVIGMVDSFCDEPGRRPTRHHYINRTVRRLMERFDTYVLAGLSVPWNRMMSVSFVRDNDIRFGHSRISDDVLFGYRFALARPRLAYLERIVIKVRQHFSAQSLARGFESKVDDVVETGKALLEFTRRLSWKGYMKLHGQYLAYFLIRHSANPRVLEYILQRKRELGFADRVAIVARLILNTRSPKWLALL